MRPVPFLRGRLDTGSLIRTDYTQDCDRGICYQRIRRILPSRTSGSTLTYKHYRTNAEQTRTNHLKPKPITSSTFLSRVRAILRILCCVATTGFECLAFHLSLIVDYDETFAIKLSGFCTLESDNWAPACWRPWAPRLEMVGCRCGSSQETRAGGENEGEAKRSCSLFRAPSLTLSLLLILLLLLLLLPGAHSCRRARAPCLSCALSWIHLKWRAGGAHTRDTIPWHEGSSAA